MGRGKGRYIDYLAVNLEKAGETPEACSWIMRQGIWFRNGDPDYHTLCDVIAVYPSYASCMQVAMQNSDYTGAREVLESSEAFVEKELGYSCVDSKVVDRENLKKHGKKGKANNRHELYLDRLIERMDEVDEEMDDVRWIMRDGIWLKENSKECNKLCDIVAVRDDNSVSCIELKGSYENEPKAREQLESSEKFTRDVLGYTDVSTKVVFYRENNSENNYDFKEIS